MRSFIIMKDFRIKEISLAAAAEPEAQNQFDMDIFMQNESICIVLPVSLLSILNTAQCWTDGLQESLHRATEITCIT